MGQKFPADMEKFSAGNFCLISMCTKTQIAAEDFAQRGNTPRHIRFSRKERQ